MYMIVYRTVAAEWRRRRTGCRRQDSSAQEPGKIHMHIPMNKTKATSGNEHHIPPKGMPQQLG